MLKNVKIGNRLGRVEGFVRALDWGELEDSSLYLVMDLVPDARELDLVTVERLAAETPTR